ncbi:MAG: BatA domain-containing protein, partial [Planctomycetaceae bacterium]|nr:BatA domain-containing protein [Planctomycetaceae bacterium]
MAFVNLSLLLGGAFVAIPVVLHLIMRQKPKPLVFPAVRFIQQRRIANQRRLQLRHWILLALRCAAIGLVALALARPSVASADMSNWLAIGLVGAAAVGVAIVAAIALVVRAPKPLVFGLCGVAAAQAIALLVMVVRSLWGGAPVIGDQEAPVAAVLVVDTSPRMDYRHENRTRLEVARDTADWLIRQFPADSEVAVIDSRSGSGAFAVDRAAAAKMVERVRPTGTPRPLPETIATGIQIAKQHEHTRKEVYVFTDLAQAAWTTKAGDELPKLLADNRNVLLYLIDVGVEKPRNFALGDLALSTEVVPQGGELALDVEVRALGPGGNKTIELQLEETDPTLPIIRDGKAVLPKPVRRGSQEVKLAGGAAERVQFVLRKLDPGVHQGLVRILGEDGLALDDVRFFAIEVQEAWPVLVAAPPEVATTYFIEAIAPREFRETGRARFKCDAIDQSRLAQTELADYRAVVLLDPAPLTPDLWTKLADYADQGGGVGAFLGHNAQSLAPFQDPAAISLLGGKLTRQTRSAGDLFIAPRSFDHPITAAFRQIETSVPWDRFPIYYHWNLDELAPDARTIIPFGNNKPALVEHRVGRGRVLTLTTPVSDPPRPTGYEAWNRLATGEDAWPYLMLVNESMLYLVGSGQTRLNLQAGEAAVLPNDEALYPPRYQLFTPLDQPQDLLARDGRLTVRFTDNPGAYRL